MSKDYCTHNVDIAVFCIDCAAAKFAREVHEHTMKPEQAFNKLSFPEAERLALLLEELGEAQQAIGKILRHGYESSDPTKRDGITNRKQLVIEMGDVEAALRRMYAAGDIDQRHVELRAREKHEHIGSYLHHQEKKR